MIDKLSAASEQLCSALNTYFSVCLEVQHVIDESPSIIFDDPKGRLAHEMDMINSYEKVLKRAKLIVGQARNRSSSLSINVLPSEILAQIFLLVVQSEAHCPNYKYMPHSIIKSHPKYPDLLTHVCSSWRNIMIDCPQFWSHIDFNYWESDGQLLYDRAEAYFARTGGRPLHIHHVFAIHNSINPIRRSMDPIFRAAPHACAVEIDIYIGPESWPLDLYDAILRVCLHCCVPGKLKHLTISAHSMQLGAFTNTDYALELNSAQAAIFASATKLCLKGAHPPWASPAYHGLVELRLKPSGTTSISQPELIAVLASSPRLKILEFDIFITTPPQPSTEPITIPVHLAELHTLTTGKPTLLPLIAPGPTGLNVSFLRSSEFSPESREVQEFFSRSNITRICVTQWASYTELFDLIALAPHAQAVIFHASSCQAEIGEIPPLKLTLADLDMIDNDRIRLEDLQMLVKAFRVRKLTLSMNKIVYNNKLLYDGRSNEVHDTEAFQALLSICPSVHIISPILPQP